MEILPGVTLRKAWRRISDNAKQDLVKQVAGYQVELFRHKFSAIGNLLVKPEAKRKPNGLLHATIAAASQQAKESNHQTLPILGQVVSLRFFWGEHINRDLPRGPFYSAEDWICARLTLVLSEQERILKTSEDEYDIEEAEEITHIARRLLELIPRFFPSHTTSSLETALFHNDLNQNNILIDSEGKITGVVDWECVSALPLWKACSLPEFLEGKDRTEKPKGEEYAEDTGDYCAPGMDLSDNLDNDGVNPLYWEYLQEYELTQLRKVFHTEMEILEPRWKEEFEIGSEKADFEEAVHSCDNTWRTRKVNKWLDALEMGECWSVIRSFSEPPVPMIVCGE